MKYLFVLGRNPQLSIAEIISYFESNGIVLISHASMSNSLLVEVDGKIDTKKVVNDLGGTIAIGKVIFSGKTGEIAEQIKKNPIYFGRENKVVYSVLIFAEGESSEEILDSMKVNFSNEGLKARYKGVSGTIKLQSGHVVQGSPEKIQLRDVNYFFFEGKDSAFGVLESSSDSEEIEKRDIGKPVRRESLAISPRLAKILINLSQVKANETLLDPFCGIGVILHEALLKNINVIGIDLDVQATEDAKKNVEWLKKNYKISSNSKIVNYDSGKYPLDKIDGVATEPSLGELMTTVPTREKALSIMRDFENLIIRVINNVKKSMRRDGKIAFTAPLITTQKGKMSCNIEHILEGTGLWLYEFKQAKELNFPIKEFREGKIVNREIYVLLY